MTPPRGWLTIPEVCADLGVTEDDWPGIQVATGTRSLLGVVGPDGRPRIRRCDLELWVDDLPAAIPEEVLKELGEWEDRPGDNGRGDAS